MERVNPNLVRVPKDVYKNRVSWLVGVRPGIKYSMWKQFYCCHGIWKTIKPTGMSSILWADVLDHLFSSTSLKKYLHKRCAAPLSYVVSDGFDCIITDSPFIHQVLPQAHVLNVPRIARIAGDRPWVKFMQALIKGQGPVSVSWVPPTVLLHGKAQLRPVPRVVVGKKRVLVLSDMNVSWCHYMTEQLMEQGIDAVAVCILLASRHSEVV